jgi:hypothetical protein
MTERHVLDNGYGAERDQLVMGGAQPLAREIAIRSHGENGAEATRLEPRSGGCMPLYWTIDSRERLFTGVGEGDVTLDDAMGLLEALEGAKALSYRKLFDGRAVTSAMSGDDLLALCAKIRAYHEQGPVGALAMVGTNEQTVLYARLLGALASADRPIKVFTSLRQARSWLALQKR